MQLRESIREIGIISVHSVNKLMKCIFEIPTSSIGASLNGGILAEVVAVQEPRVVPRHWLPQRENELLLPKTRNRVKLRQSLQSLGSTEEGRSGIEGQEFDSFTFLRCLEPVDVSIEVIVGESFIKEMWFFTPTAGHAILEAVGE